MLIKIGKKVPVNSDCFSLNPISKGTVLELLVPQQFYILRDTLGYIGALEIYKDKDQGYKKFKNVMNMKLESALKGLTEYRNLDIEYVGRCLINLSDLNGQYFRAIENEMDFEFRFISDCVPKYFKS